MTTLDRWQEIVWLHPYRVTLLHRLMPPDAKGVRALVSSGTVERYLETGNDGSYHYQVLAGTPYFDVRQPVPDHAQWTDAAGEALRTVARGQLLAAFRAQYTDMG